MTRFQLAVAATLCAVAVGCSSSSNDSSSSSSGATGTTPSGTNSIVGNWSGSISTTLNIVCGGGIAAQCSIITFSVLSTNNVSCFRSFFGVITDCKLGPPLDSGTGTAVQNNTFFINQGGGFTVTGQFDSATSAHGTLTTAPGYFGTATSQTQFSWTASRN